MRIPLHNALLALAIGLSAGATLAAPGSSKGLAPFPPGTQLFHEFTSRVDGKYIEVFGADFKLINGVASGRFVVRENDGVRVWDWARDVTLSDPQACSPARVRDQSVKLIRDAYANGKVHEMGWRVLTPRAMQAGRRVYSEPDYTGAMGTEICFHTHRAFADALEGAYIDDYRKQAAAKAASLPAERDRSTVGKDEEQNDYSDGLTDEAHAEKLRLRKQQAAEQKRAQEQAQAAERQARAAAAECRTRFAAIEQAERDLDSQRRELDSRELMLDTSAVALQARRAMMSAFRGDAADEQRRRDEFNADIQARNQQAQQLAHDQRAFNRRVEALERRSEAYNESDCVER